MISRRVSRIVLGFGVGMLGLGLSVLWSAFATSIGGVGQSPSVTTTVNYTMSWLPPLSLGKVVAGAVAIKFAAKDCNGAFVADNRVRVEVWEGATLRCGANYGDGSDAVRIDTDSGQYIANFQPAAGAHNFTLKVLFDGFEQATKNFSTK